MRKGCHHKKIKLLVINYEKSQKSKTLRANLNKQKLSDESKVTQPWF